MKCPVCDTELRAVERSGVEIDHCPRCRGVWLDRGELEKLIERSSAGAHDDGDDAFSRSFPGERNRDRPNEPYRKKKKSLLGELFDF
ncbi:MAG: zf-TFIIB domain-containing protein [Bryobacterales bacterium]|nr:zf-TFIIB domain-containing protein [Bryobacterales bacterium]